MRVSSAHLTVRQTNAGEPHFPEFGEKRSVWCEYCAVLQEHPGQTVTHDGRRWCAETDTTSRCFTHLPLSVALGVRKGGKQG